MVLILFFLAVVSLWFCKMLQKSYFLSFWFFFVCLMKTIHVNITSKKNVYFYDFWVITLLFANKIFNDNQLAPRRVLFLWMKLTRSAQVLNAVVVFVSRADVWFVIVSAQLPSEPTSACGALMESDEVRASSCSLTDRAWIFAWLKKIESVSARRLTAAKFDSCQKASCRWPTCQELWAQEAGENKEGGEKKKTSMSRWKSRE